MTQTEVLKLARKTLALCKDHPWRSQAIAELDKLIEQKSNALAQPEQEPVAHVLFRQDDDGLEPIIFYPSTTAPDPQTLKDRFILKDVWLSPPQRTWVGLTLNERLELAQDVDWAAGAYCEYAEKVEAKLKEKNT